MGPDTLIIALNVLAWTGIAVMVIGILLGLVIFIFVVWELMEIARMQWRQ